MCAVKKGIFMNINLSNRSNLTKRAPSERTLALLCSRERRTISRLPPACAGRPTGETEEFVSELPEDLKTILNKLEKEYKNIMITLLEKFNKDQEKNLPDLRPGDTVKVHQKIKEGEKERVQQFTGVVIQRKNERATASFTVRKISNGVGVERIFPIASPFIDKIEVNKVGIVRRAKLFYLRTLTGKAARIREKIQNKKDKNNA
jgi:large subunit ribosomal protein L19